VTGPAEQGPWRPGPSLFAAAVLAHIVLLEVLGPSSVLTPKLDANVYLELAQNLWREGRFVTGSGKVYPPGYPLLLSPLFAIESNGFRFALIYALHGLLLAGGAWTLRPLVRDLAGERLSWIAIASAQLLAGTTVHALHPRTETLFTALVMVSVALVYRLARAPDRRGALALGVVVGFMLATRRTGLAFAAAAAVMFALRFAAARPRGRLREEASLALAAALGGLLGFSPELLVTLMEGPVKAYSEGVLGSHLGAGLDALGSGKARIIIAASAAQHLSYYALSSLGLAILVPAALLSRPEARPDLPPGVAQTTLYTGLGALFLAALSTLHVVRYWLRRDLEVGYDLYPRYLDPLEPVWLLLGFGLACAVMRGGRLRGALGGIVATLGLVVIAGEVVRPRGFRLPWPNLVRDRLHWPFDPNWYFTVQCVVVLVLFGLLLVRGRLGRWWVPLLAVAL